MTKTDRISNWVLPSSSSWDSTHRTASAVTRRNAMLRTNSILSTLPNQLGLTTEFLQSFAHRQVTPGWQMLLVTTQHNQFMRIIPTCKRNIPLRFHTKQPIVLQSDPCVTEDLTQSEDGGHAGMPATCNTFNSGIILRQKENGFKSTISRNKIEYGFVKLIQFNVRNPKILILNYAQQGAFRQNTNGIVELGFRASFFSFLALFLYKLPTMSDSDSFKKV